MPSRLQSDLDETHQGDPQMTFILPSPPELSLKQREERLGGSCSSSCCGNGPKDSCASLSPSQAGSQPLAVAPRALESGLAPLIGSHNPSGAGSWHHLPPTSICSPEVMDLSPTSHSFAGLSPCAVTSQGRGACPSLTCSKVLWTHLDSPGPSCVELKPLSDHFAGLWCCSVTPQRRTRRILLAFSRLCKGRRSPKMP